MKAALLERYKAPLVLADVPEPRPGPGEVLVRTVGCGVCRTDLHMIDGLAYRPNLPHILGHEPAGTVARLGEGVTGLAVGARVAPYLFDACGTCPACRAGDHAQCENNAGILGVTLETVKIRLHRARALLRKDLEAKCRLYRDEENELACHPKN